ncbi:MAG: ABC transporter permease [Bdellovibrionota bacterium]
MNQILLIARKDLRSYFTSPIAYIVIAMFLLIIGFMFANLFSYFAQSIAQYSAVNYGQKPTLTDMVIRQLFGNINVVLLFVAPFITMRLIAEEKKDHTIELLMTAPVRPLEIVLGKFLAGLGLILVMLGLTLVYPVILYFTATPDWGVIASCYFGIVLVAAAYVAIGLLWSALTENQIVAAVLTFGTLLLFWLIGWSAHRAGPIWSDVLNYLSLIGHYTNMAQGTLDTSDVVFYLSFAGFSLFLTKLVIDSN